METYTPESNEQTNDDWKHEFKSQLSDLPYREILYKRSEYIICDLSSLAKENLFFVAYSDDVPINYTVISTFYDLKELVYRYRYIIDDLESDIIGLKKRLEKLAYDVK
jgi:hypothetical protein